MYDINLTILNFINGAAGNYQYLDWLILFVTSSLTYATMIMVALFLLIVVPLRAKSRESWRTSISHGLAYGVGVLSTWVIVQAIKILVAAPRPFVTLTSINALSPYESGYSFPSGHAAVTFAAATAVWLHNRRLGALLYAFAFLVCVSRVYIGVHYPVDIVAGAVLGIVVAWAVHRVFAFKAHHTGGQ